MSTAQRTRRQPPPISGAVPQDPMPTQPTTTSPTPPSSQSQTSHLSRNSSVKDMRSTASTTPPAYFAEYAPPSPPQSLRPTDSPPLAPPYPPPQNQERTTPPQAQTQGQQQYQRSIPRVPPPPVPASSDGSSRSSEWRVTDDSAVDDSSHTSVPSRSHAQDFHDVEAGTDTVAYPSKTSHEWTRHSPTLSNHSNQSNSNAPPVPSPPISTLAPSQAAKPSQRPRIPPSSTSPPIRAHVAPHLSRVAQRALSSSTGVTLPSSDRRIPSPSPLGPNRANTDPNIRQFVSTTPSTSPPYQIPSHDLHSHSPNEAMIHSRRAQADERQQYSPPFEYDTPRAEQESVRSAGRGPAKTPDRSFPVQEEEEDGNEDHSVHSRHRERDQPSHSQAPPPPQAHSHSQPQSQPQSQSQSHAQSQSQSQSQRDHAQREREWQHHPQQQISGNYGHHPQGKLSLHLPLEHGSPTPSSALMRPDTDGEMGLDLDAGHQLTPRSPSIPLPHPSFFAQMGNGAPGSNSNNGDFDPNAFQNALYALNTDLPAYNNHSHNAQHASRRLVGNTRQGYHYVPDSHHHHPPHNHPQAYPSGNARANFDFEAWSGDVSLASPATSYAYARPAAPAPPTPYSATNAPTPAPVHAPIPQRDRDRDREQAAYTPGPQHHHLQQQFPHLMQGGGGQQHWPRQFFANNHSHNMHANAGRVPGGSRQVPYAPSSYTSSPYPDHSPFLPRPPPAHSTASSPSHQPVPLPERPLIKYPSRYASLAARKAEMLRRGESTEPLETETEEEGERTEGRAESAVGGANGAGTGDEEEGDLWEEEDEEDVLELEYHPKYIANPAKRGRKFMQKWDQLVKLFHEIDRSTDTTMMLLASPPLTPHAATHVLLSRSIQRNPTYTSHAHAARSSFTTLSKARRREKAKEAQARRLEAERRKGMEESLGFTALMGRRLQELGAVSADGVKGEEGLKAALGVALGSMKEMHRIYEEREARRQQEMDRQRQESAGIEDLLRQVLSINGGAVNVNVGGSNGSGTATLVNHSDAE